MATKKTTQESADETSTDTLTPSTDTPWEGVKRNALTNELEPVDDTWTPADNKG
jgi:hypothetical protein